MSMQPSLALLHVVFCKHHNRARRARFVRDQLSQNPWQTKVFSESAAGLQMAEKCRRVKPPAESPAQTKIIQIVLDVRNNMRMGTAGPGGPFFTAGSIWQ